MKQNQTTTKKTTVKAAKPSLLARWKALSRKAKTISVCAAALGVLLIGGGITAAILAGNFSYTSSNLSRYVKLKDGYLDGISVNVPLESVKDEDVERTVNQLLVKTKSQTFGGVQKLNGTMTLGDIAYIYYRGYTVDETGAQHDVDGACNFSLDAPSELELGSGNFIPGFEEGLLGKDITNTSKFRKITSGLPEAGEVLYVSYSTYDENSNLLSYSDKRILFEKETLDAEYGAGFYDMLILSGIGTDSIPFTMDDAAQPLVDKNGVGHKYYAVQINFATNCESKPLTVQGYFPADYGAAELQGKTVTFDVFVDYFVPYETPELTDAFVTETLGYTADDLAAYAGATLAEKYRALVRAELETDYTQKREDAVNAKITEALLAAATFDALPDGEAEAVVKEVLLPDIQSSFEQFRASENYDENVTFDQFADMYCLYYLGKTEMEQDYRDFLLAEAEKTVKEKLVFYAAARDLGVLPKGKDLAAARDEIIEETLTYFLSQDSEMSRSQFETEDAYRDAVADFKEKMLDYYGEEYFEENGAYRYAMRRLAERVSVTVTDPRD